MRLHFHNQISRAVLAVLLMDLNIPRTDGAFRVGAIKAGYKAKVFYYPFNWNPYSEVTETDISHQWDLTSCVSPKIESLLKLLSQKGNPSRKYLPGATRLKVELRNDDIYFVDVQGNVKFEASRTHKVEYHSLSAAQRESVHQFVLHQLPSG